jgi:hypothetical protein
MDFEPGANAVRAKGILAGGLWLAAFMGPAGALAAAAPSPPGAPALVVAPPAQQPTLDSARVSLDGPVRLASNPAPSPLWTAALAALSALLGSLVGYWSTQRSSRASIIQKTNELEIESIDRRLSEFVGPFMQLSAENMTLSLELKRRHGSTSFRTLTALLTPGWRDGLSRGDANLLEVVVQNGVELRRLLMEKSAAVVSPQLIPFFSQASSHFRFLELAYKGSLDEDAARYEAYVYPRQLDRIMELELARLQTRRELLRSQPHRPHARMTDLELGSLS